MDDKDLYEIITRAQAVRDAIPRVDTLTQMYRAGEVRLTQFPGDVLPLATQQRSGLKTRTQNVINRGKAVCDGLAGPTGLTGTPFLAQVQQVEQQPMEVFNIFDQYIQALANKLKENPLQDDGTVRATYEDALAQEIADVAATLGAVMRHYIGTLELRLS